MAKRYGILRPQVQWNVQWEGDNLDEIHEAFGPDMSSYLFVNEDTGALCYGSSLEDARQYEVGSWLSVQAGISHIPDEQWHLLYQEVATGDPVVYDVSNES